jgi:tetratricopeptide (TPR) repeat protein
MNSQPLCSEPLEIDHLHESAAVLALIANELTSHPCWALPMLDSTTQQLLAPLWRVRRDAALQAGNVQSAIEFGERLWGTGRGGADDADALANAYMKCGRLHAALDCAERAIRLTSDNAAFQQTHARVVDAMRRQDAASGPELAAQHVPGAGTAAVPGPRRVTADAPVATLPQAAELGGR